MKGVYFCHPGFGVVINQSALISEGTYIQHGVTIGVRDDIKNPKVPEFGRNCYIGARVTIIGDVTIGDKAKIGAGPVVIHDVPDGATTVGVPADNIINSNQLLNYCKNNV